MEYLLNVTVSIAFDGLAFAMILFIISVGLSVTMGLMGFVNLAHGAFAMVGGYISVSLMRASGAFSRSTYRFDKLTALRLSKGRLSTGGPSSLRV